MKALSIAVFALCLSSCSLFSPGCLIKDQVSPLAVDTIVTTLQCSNRAAVAKSVDSIFSSVGLCNKTAETGPIANYVCPIAVKSVVDFLAVNAVPAEWKCSASNAKALLATALTGACMQLPVSQP